VVTTCNYAGPPALLQGHMQARTNSKGGKELGKSGGKYQTTLPLNQQCLAPFLTVSTTAGFSKVGPSDTTVPRTDLRPPGNL
jgi:hypothetical protein